MDVRRFKFLKLPSMFLGGFQNSNEEVVCTIYFLGL